MIRIRLDIMSRDELQAMRRQSVLDKVRDRCLGPSYHKLSMLDDAPGLGVKVDWDLVQAHVRNLSL